MSNPQWNHVVHHETDEPAYRISDGKYEEVVWNYEDVNFPIYNDEGDTLDLEQVEQIPLTFKWNILYNPQDTEIIPAEFGGIVGDILMQIIEEGLDNDTIKFNTESGENNTPQLDSE